METLTYKGLPTFRDNKHFLTSMLSFTDPTGNDDFDEIMNFAKKTFSSLSEQRKKESLDENYDAYLVFKQELEGLLVERERAEVNRIAVENGYTQMILENEGEKEKDALAERILVTFERIYYEIFHEDENYRPEVIQTPMDELLSRPCFLGYCR